MKGTKDMAKLVFNYGAMGSSKTANALMVAYNYEERGQHALILKPATDTRDGIHTVSSRIGLSNTCRLIDEFLDEFTKNPDCVLNYNAIIVDEAQFASPEQIDLFSDIVDTWQIPVLCYGLRADFQNKFFPGSRRSKESELLGQDPYGGVLTPNQLSVQIHRLRLRGNDPNPGHPIMGDQLRIAGILSLLIGGNHPRHRQAGNLFHQKYVQKSVGAVRLGYWVE